MPEKGEDIESATTLVEGSNSSAFKHPQLFKGDDAFRLLRILPGRSGFPVDLIRCELFAASISSSEGEYIAGSYVWGPPEPTTPIFLNGVVFPIRENLFHFLRACRKRAGVQIMWIDAICINQDDIEERSHQVRAMDKIYTCAKSVYCWLGWKIQIAKSFDICDQARFGKTFLSVMRKNDSQIDFALRMLAQSEYWTRVWIVQEFLLAKEIFLLAGLKKIPYRRLDRLLSMPVEAGVTFEDLMARSSVVLNLKNPRSSRILQMRKYREEKGHWDLEYLFEAFGAMPCSVSRDRIFALLGLVKGQDPSLELERIVDYDLTVWELLGRILTSGLLRSPIAFAHRYAENVILEEEDEHMKSTISLNLSARLQLPQHQVSNCLDIGLKTPQPHLCFQALELCSSTSDDDSAAPFARIFLYSWPTWPPRSYVLLLLSTFNTTSLPYPVHTCALIDPCENACTTRCSGHLVLGFAVSSFIASFPEHPTTRSLIRAVRVKNSNAYDHSSRSRSLLHTKLQNDILPAALSTFQSTIHIHKVSGQDYDMRTQLDALVKLARTVKEIEEGIILEVLG